MELTCGLTILEIRADNEPAISLPLYFKSVKNENMFKEKTKQYKTKQNDPNKRKKESLLRES